MSKLSTVDSEYKEWIQDVSRRFKRSQIKAAIKVNDEGLRFYWSLGKDISEKGMEANIWIRILSISAPRFCLQMGRKPSSYTLV